MTIKYYIYDLSLGLTEEEEEPQEMTKKEFCESIAFQKECVEEEYGEDACEIISKFDKDFKTYAYGEINCFGFEIRTETAIRNDPENDPEYEGD